MGSCTLCITNKEKSFLRKYVSDALALNEEDDDPYLRDGENEISNAELRNLLEKLA